MFYGTLIDFMSEDPAIASTVTEYVSDEICPSIFPQKAPEDAERPYIIVRINETGGAGDGVVNTYNVYIDYYDYDKSISKAIASSRAVRNRLKRISLCDDDVTDIRFFLNSDGLVPADDSREIHYNTLFSARGADAAWMRENR